MTEAPPVPSGLEFKDRRGGLIGFGILLVILGCICALFVPLMIVGQAFSAASTGVPGDSRLMAPIIVQYAGLAVAFIAFGIGSMRARRWARALVLIVAWLWLLTGIVSTGVMAIMMPKMLASPPGGGPALSDPVRTVVVVVTVIFMVAIFVVLPGILVLFYGSRHVKATVEARNPVPGWTDACPLPVLALSLGLGLGAVSTAAMLATYHSAVPFFGLLVTGVPGTGIALGVIAVWVYCAWAIYRLRPAGWWTVLVGCFVMTASWALTLTQVDVFEVYRTMGYPEKQLAQMQQSGILTNRLLITLSLVGPFPIVGYLLWVKKFFRGGVR
jgi:hypothetical protein